MEAIINIFRMKELSVNTRIKIIKQLGRAINNELGLNATEPLVYELVLALDPFNSIADDDSYTMFYSDKEG